MFEIYIFRRRWFPAHHRDRLVYFIKAFTSRGLMFTSQLIRSIRCPWAKFMLVLCWCNIGPIFETISWWCSIHPLCKLMLPRYYKSILSNIQSHISPVMVHYKMFPGKFVPFGANPDILTWDLFIRLFRDVRLWRRLSLDGTNLWLFNISVLFILAW